MQVLLNRVNLLIWLNNIQFLEAIGNLPVSFEKQEKLLPILFQVADTWFKDLVGAANVNTLSELAADALTPGNTLTTEQKNQVMAAGSFLGFAVWSRYVTRSNVTVTDTGLVTKLNQHSDPISDRQRSELSRDFSGLAEHYALELRRLIKPDPCEYVAGSGGRSSLRTVRSGRRSRFD